MNMRDKTITVISTNGVTHITLNRPERRNALSGQMIDELTEALSRTQPSEKGIILQGADGAFSAGADLHELSGVGVSADPRSGAIAVARAARHLMSLIETHPVPVVACVDGPAFGGGLELALACDWIVATARARFALPETTLGLLPGFGGTRRLVERVGPALTKELILGAAVLDADRAARCGLVSQVHASPAEMTAAVANALGGAPARSPHALGLAKAAIHAAVNETREAAFERETLLYGDAFEHEDSRLGIAAFLQKEVPAFLLRADHMRGLLRRPMKWGPAERP